MYDMVHYELCSLSTKLLQSIISTCLLFIHIVPPPSMSIFRSPSGIVFVSDLVVVTCNATLPSAVNTNVSATIIWSGPNGVVMNSDGRIRVNQTGSIDENNSIQSILTFQPVFIGEDTNDSGDYTCRITISSSNSLVLNGSNSIVQEVEFTG